MVAVLAPSSSAPSAPTGSLRRPARQPFPAVLEGRSGPAIRRTPLRVIEGGRSAAPTASVYLRRRIVAVVLAAALVLALVAGIQAVAPLLATPGSPAAGAPASASVDGLAPIASATYSVRPGDTLWSIATRIDPDGDPRPLVDELRSRVGGVGLEAGQRIDLAGLVG